MRKKVLLLALTSMLMSLCVPTCAQQQFSIKDDTIKIDTAVYRLSEGQTYKYFIRKLPGVEILEDGTITVNGKKVTRILLNGPDINKEDTTLKRLTAEMIEKVKAYEESGKLEEYEYIIEIKQISADVNIDSKGNKIFQVPEGITLKELLSQLPGVQTDKKGRLLTKSRKDIVTSIEFNGGKVYPENTTSGYPDDYKLLSGAIHVVIMDRKHFRKYLSKTDRDDLPKRRAEITISYYPRQNADALLNNILRERHIIENSNQTHYEK